jgi:hypothetical protein
MFTVLFCSDKDVLHGMQHLALTSDISDGPSCCSDNGYYQSSGFAAYPGIPAYRLDRVSRFPDFVAS